MSNSNSSRCTYSSLDLSYCVNGNFKIKKCITSIHEEILEFTHYILIITKDHFFVHRFSIV